jgi:hypothetical protein
MDVIGVLCVSLGSSTVQLHDSLGSRCACVCSEAGYSSQNGYRAWGVCYQRAAFSCDFCGQKDSMQRIFIKQCFLCRVWSVYCVKRSTIARQMFRWWRRSWNGGAEMTKKTVKRLLCCGFLRTGKALGQIRVYQCWWRICREMNVFSRFEYHIF